MGTDCPFRVLGVAEDASRDEIASAFRLLAHRTHPDHGGDAAVFRRALDAYREACRRVMAPAVAASGARPGRVGDPYRSFLVSLDAAARLPVREPVAAGAARPPAAGAAHPPAAVPAERRRRSASARRFAAVLADVQARTAA